MKQKVLVTGGAGFLGTHFVAYLLQKGGYDIVIFDKLEPDILKKNPDKVQYIKGNIRSIQDVQDVFKQFGPFSIVFHLAAEMPDKSASEEVTWETNVLGTKNIVSESVKNGVKNFVFTSSNVTYGIPEVLPVTEETPVHPLEIYGKSKLQAEKELEKFTSQINIQIFRCPVISGVGRLGLQAILFEFISENRNVYVLGDGSNKYQFVDADDVCMALEKAGHMKGFDIYTIGSDGILTLKEIYQKVIDFAKSSSKIVSLPKIPALLSLSILDKLNISPLGVYQYTMIGRSMYADTTKIKKKLGWKPKMTNADSFIENYKWYQKHKGEFIELGSGNVSSNKSVPKLKAFRLLKLFS